MLIWEDTSEIRRFLFPVSYFHRFLFPALNTGDNKTPEPVALWAFAGTIPPHRERPLEWMHRNASALSGLFLCRMMFPTAQTCCQSRDTWKGMFRNTFPIAPRSCTNCCLFLRGGAKKQFAAWKKKKKMRGQHTAFYHNTLKLKSLIPQNDAEYALWAFKNALRFHFLGTEWETNLQSV